VAANFAQYAVPIRNAIVVVASPTYPFLFFQINPPELQVSDTAIGSDVKYLREQAIFLIYRDFKRIFKLRFDKKIKLT
jgi:hypothetical protein